MAGRQRSLVPKNIQVVFTILFTGPTRLVHNHRMSHLWPNMQYIPLGKNSIFFLNKFHILPPRIGVSSYGLAVSLIWTILLMQSAKAVSSGTVVFFIQKETLWGDVYTKSIPSTAQDLNYSSTLAHRISAYQQWSLQNEHDQKCRIDLSDQLNIFEKPHWLEKWYNK